MSIPIQKLVLQLQYNNQLGLYRKTKTMNLVRWAKIARLVLNEVKPSVCTVKYACQSVYDSVTSFFIPLWLA